MRVLAITQIWPNSLEPLRATFNVQQFAEVARHVDLTVLAAVPYFPAAELIGSPPRPALLARLPAREVLQGIETVYLRQLYVPKVGVPLAVPLYLASLSPHRALLRRADVVFGTWAYPDGCAAILAARALGKPCVVKVHGSDLNLVAKIPSARAVLRRVLPRAHAMVSVSRPLSSELQELGVSRERIHLVENGIDARLFAPRDKAEGRRELGLQVERKIVLFVGRLEPQKGLHDLLEAWSRVRAVRKDAMLALVGDGALRAEVEDRIAADPDALVAPGARPLAEVARWMAACDVFTLPSWSEGTPNVILEALASGRPAVGTRVGGIPDVLGNSLAGILVQPRNPEALARGLLDALSRSWDAESVRLSGPCSWADSARHLVSVLATAR